MTSHNIAYNGHAQQKLVTPYMRSRYIHSLKTKNPLAHQGVLYLKKLTGQHRPKNLQPTTTTNWKVSRL